ncbi:DUF4870 domain-containing protein [Salibacterium aidingense]|uniref:DUF4870 domain-containing protein n=1 Tax=Salibacterium aidingense TaxID=384933 RepID=UPI00042188AC|nr:DUF4870 domain-containing protein [Salibacterium aidingense]
MTEEERTEDGAQKTKNKTSMDLDENVAGLLCYLLGIITGVIFLVLEKENRFVRFHAMQSTFIFVVLFVLNVILTAVPVIGWVFSLLLAPLSFILWLVLMWQAYKGNWFKLPVLGDMAEEKSK